MSTPTVKRAPVVVDPTRIHFYFDKLSAGGWQSLLPVPHTDKVLCVDGLDGWTTLLLRDRYQKVVAAHVDTARLDATKKRVNDGNIDGVSFWNLSGNEIDATDRDCDGVVVHDPKGSLLTGKVLDDALWQRLMRRVRPGGFVYLSLPNRFSYAALRNPKQWLGLLRSPGLNSWFGLRAQQKQLRTLGVQQSIAYPYLMLNGRFTEVLLNGYRSSKNVHLFSERLREWLLGRRGSQWLCQGYCMVGALNKHSLDNRKNFSFLNNMAANPALFGAHVQEAQSCVATRYIVLNLGKAIIGLGKSASVDDSFIVIACADPMSAARRHAESDILNALDQTLPMLRGRVPAVLGHSRIAGIDCFAISAIAGISVDCNAPYLDSVTEQAVDFLTEFHRASLQTFDMSDERFATHIAPLFAATRTRNPVLSEQLLALEGALRAQLIDKPFYSAWLHGDFKIENMLFDRQTHQLNGVIDWELSQQTGAPVLDLWYLLAYNRSMRSGARVHDIFAHMFADNDLSAVEQALYQRYHAALPGVMDLAVAWQALCFVHHIGVRIHYGWPDEKMANHLNDILLSLTKKLTSATDK